MLGFPILYLKGMSIMMFLGFRAEGARMPMFFRKDGGVVRASKVLLRILVVTVLQRARPPKLLSVRSSRSGVQG